MCGFFNELLPYWYVFVCIGECFCVHVKWLRTFLTQLIFVTGLLLAHILSLKKVFYNIPQRKNKYQCKHEQQRHMCLLQIIKKIKALNNLSFGQKFLNLFIIPHTLNVFIESLAHIWLFVDLLIFIICFEVSVNMSKYHL